MQAIIITDETTGSSRQAVYRPAVYYVIESLINSGIEKILLTETVPDLGRDDVINGGENPLHFAEQSEDVFIIFGDLPLISPETIGRAYKLHTDCKNDVTAVKTEKYVPGAAWIHKDLYSHVLGDAKLSPPEIDAMPVLRSACCFPLFDSELYRAVDPTFLYRINITLRDRGNKKFAASGVEITDPSGVTIAPGTKLGKNVVIHKGTIIKPGCEIGDRCELGPDTIIDHSVIGEGAVINSSQIEYSVVGEGVKIGPYSHIRPNSDIGANVKIGNFVEVKNSKIGEKTSVAHLTYVGDTDCGKNVNWGCGCVTVNYDGSSKYRTVVEDDSFIGCNTNLIAPVTVKSNSYIAAGSTITDEVPEGSLAIARARQINKDGWRKK